MEIDDNVKMPESWKKDQDNDYLLSSGSEVVFTYIPYEQLNKLWIMGDFTDWEPKEMIKTKDVFIYKCILIKGFKYYYCYNSQDNFYVDFNHPYELNTKNNQSNNYIELLNEDVDENVKLFDFKEKGKKYIYFSSFS